MEKPKSFFAVSPPRRELSKIVFDFSGFLNKALKSGPEFYGRCVCDGEPSMRFPLDQNKKSRIFL